MKVILKESQITTKEEMLNYISLEVAQEQQLNNSEILEGLKQREEQVSTGMVNGVAIPHTKIKGDEPLLCVVKTPGVKDWETMDGSTVELIITILAAGSDDHLKMLSQISRKLVNEENINNLKASTTVEQIKETLDV